MYPDSTPRFGGTPTASGVQDLDSRNGTYVNGEKLGKDPYKLRNRDRIEVGVDTVHWVFMEPEATMEVPRHSPP